MAIDWDNSSIVSHADMVGLDADKGAELLVLLIDRLVPLSLTSLEQKPKVAEPSKDRSRDVIQSRVSGEVGHDIVEDDSHRDDVGR